MTILASWKAILFVLGVASIVVAFIAPPHDEHDDGDDA